MAIVTRDRIMAIVNEAVSPLNILAGISSLLNIIDMLSVLN